MNDFTPLFERNSRQFYTTLLPLTHKQFISSHRKFLVWYRLPAILDDDDDDYLIQKKYPGFGSE